MLISHTFEATQALVERMGVVGLFSLAVLQRKLAKLCMRPLHLCEQLPELSIHVVLRRDTRLTSVAAQVLDILRASRAVSAQAV